MVGKRPHRGGLAGSSGADQHVQLPSGGGHAERSGALAAAYERWFVKGNALVDKGLNLPISDDLLKAWERLR